jgi:enoyl-CoA hydratase/carnithine racemase
MHYQAGEWGLLPGWGGTQRLPGLIGPARARRMMLAGYPVRAEEATIWGLVDAVYPENPQDANEGLNAWLAAIKKQHPPVVGRLKIALASSQSYHFESERTAFAACFADGTTQARIRAWLQNKSGGDRRASAVPSVPRPTLSESGGEHPGTSSSSGANYG